MSLTACSSDGTTSHDASQTVCNPYDVAPCTCPNDVQGGMTCRPDGTGYFDCVCNGRGGSTGGAAGDSFSQPTAGTQADASQPPITLDSGGSTIPATDSSVPAPVDAGARDGADAQNPTSGAGTGGDGTAATGAAGAAGVGGTDEPPTLDTCPDPPFGASDQAIEAWTIVNEYRLAAGAGCMNMVTELNASAQTHCDYRAANSADRSCTPDGHTEVVGCPGFTGATVEAREIAAGYPPELVYTEVFYTYGSPALAVPGWIDTVWHRIPLLDPWSTDMGYGGGPVCATLDVGHGTSPAPDDTVAVYPYDGQTEVPPSWSGLESPAPPPPPGGWPGSYPINIYAQRLSVTEHVLTKDGDNTPIEHLFLDATSPGISWLGMYLSNTVFLYGAPFELNTKYRVKIVGTYTGGALNKEWTFTTGSRRPFGI